MKVPWRGIKILYRSTSGDDLWVTKPESLTEECYRLSKSFVGKFVGWLASRAGHLFPDCGKRFLNLAGCKRRAPSASAMKIAVRDGIINDEASSIRPPTHQPTQNRDFFTKHKCD